MQRLIAPALAVVALGVNALAPKQLLAHDDGRFANSPLKAWFDRLASGKGLCCSFADGVSVQDVDWDTQNGRYRVRLTGNGSRFPMPRWSPNRIASGRLWYGHTRTPTERRRSAASYRAPVPKFRSAHA